MTKKTVVLLSGGLDSAANLALACEAGDQVRALTLLYSQRAEANEIQASQDLCAYYNVPNECVDVRWLGRLGGSSLTDLGANVPELDASELDQTSVTEQSAQSVWVPNRNGIFIHVAAAYAERWGAEQVLVGFNAEEAVTFPDNSIEYLDRVNQALHYSTRNHVKVSSYTSEWNKSQMVSALRQLKQPVFPFHLVWSCYHSGLTPCEKCESCQRFRRALLS